MLSGYHQVAAFWDESDDPWQRLEEKLATCVLEIPEACRPSFLIEDENLENAPKKLLYDFLMLVEFCELVGPTVHLTSPKVMNSAEETTFLNELCLKIMATDLQHCAKPDEAFCVVRDSHIIFYDELLACQAHYFTLYDLEARGFVRSFCLAFVTRSCPLLDNRQRSIERIFQNLVVALHQQNMRQFYRAVWCKWRCLNYISNLLQNASPDGTTIEDLAEHELKILNQTSLYDVAVTMEQVQAILDQCRGCLWYIEEKVEEDLWDIDSIWNARARPPIINVKAPKIVEGRTLKPWFVIAGVTEADFECDLNSVIDDLKLESLSFNFFETTHRQLFNFAMISPAVTPDVLNFSSKSSLLNSIHPQNNEIDLPYMKSFFNTSSELMAEDIIAMTLGFSPFPSEMSPVSDYFESRRSSQQSEIVSVPTGSINTSPGMTRSDSNSSWGKSAATNQSNRIVLQAALSKTLPQTSMDPFHTIDDAHGITINNTSPTALLTSPLFSNPFEMRPVVFQNFLSVLTNHPNRTTDLIAAILCGQNVVVVSDVIKDVEIALHWLSLFLLRSKSFVSHWFCTDNDKRLHIPPNKRQFLIGVTFQLKPQLPNAVLKNAVIYYPTRGRVERVKYDRDGILYRYLSRRLPSKSTAENNVHYYSIVETLIVYIRKVFVQIATRCKYDQPVFDNMTKVTDEVIINSLATRISDAFSEERLPSIV